MKHIWTVLCQKSSIDFETNLLSLFNCIEEMTLTIDKSKAPSGNLIIPAELELVSYWLVEEKNKENSLNIKGELLDPENKILNTFEKSFPISKEILRFRNRIHIQNLPITKAGRYKFRIYQKDIKNVFRMVTELPLDINMIYVDGNFQK